jgi:hypothetical protein
MVIIKEERFTGLPQAFSTVRSDIKNSELQDQASKRIDDAKKKAITTSRDYDEFKGLVDTSHLKPIHRSEFNAPAKLASPNTVFNRGQTNHDNSHHQTVALARKNLKTRSDFVREFKRSIDKGTFLIEEGCDSIRRCLSEGLDEDIFGEIVAIVSRAAHEDENLIAIAQCFKSLPWFESAGMFMSKGEREAFDRVAPGKCS